MSNDKNPVIESAKQAFICIAELRGQALKIREGVAKSTGKPYRMAILEVAAEIGLNGLPTQLLIEVMAPQGQPDVGLIPLDKGAQIMVEAHTITNERGVLRIRSNKVGAVPDVFYPLKSPTPAETKKPQ